MPSSICAGDSQQKQSRIMSENLSLAIAQASPLFPVFLPFDFTQTK